MTTPSDDEVADGNDLSRFLDALEERTERMVTLTDAVLQNNKEVHALRGAVDTRAGKKETSHRRRSLAAAMVFYGVVIILGHDEHVERCSPGARAEEALQVVIDAQPGDPTVADKIRDAVVGRDQPKLCDVTFPFHDHDGNGYPRPYNMLGLGLYALAGVGLYAWTRGPRGWRREEEDYHT